MNVLYEDDTILVYDEVENGVEMRTLKFGPPFTHVKQGFIRLADPVFVPAPAHANMLFGASLVPKPASALVLGVGVGSIPSVLHAIDPAMHIDIVDYDPRIFQLGVPGSLASQYVVVKFGGLVVKGASYAHYQVLVDR